MRSPLLYTPERRRLNSFFPPNASNARVCLSRTEKEPAPVAPNFCMLLRKHLLGAEILSVSQYAFERIVEIRMLCTSDFSRAERVLVCELMGKYSNLILTENGIIAGALKTASLEDNARRVLLPGAKYAYPVPQDKLSPFDAEGLKERIQSFLSTHTDGDGEEYARFLFDNVAGIALPTARELLRRIPRGTPVWEFVGGFCRNQPVEACLLTSDGTPAAKRRTFSPSPSKTAYPCPPSTPPRTNIITAGRRSGPSRTKSAVWRRPSAPCTKNSRKNCRTRWSG